MKILRSVPVRLPVRLLLLVALAGGGAGATALHTQLDASDPAEDAVLAEPPERIRLVFSAPVDAGLASVTLVDAAGEQVELEPGNVEGEPESVVAAAPPLEAGSYRVVWRVVSGDGHAVSGSYVFHVEGAPAAVDSGATGVEPTGDTPPLPEEAEEAGRDRRSLPGMGLRGLAGAAVMGLAGLLTFGLLGAGEASGRVRMPGPVRAVAWLAPPLLAGHLWLWWDGIRPAGAGLEPGLLLGTAQGTLEATRLGFAVLALWALALARRPGLAAVFAWGAVLAGAGLGHALTSTPELAVPAKAVHLAAAGVWAGGLVHLLGLRPGRDAFLPGVARVSRWALWAAVTLAGSGALMALLFVERPGDLIATPYGLLLVGKVAGVAGLVALGARNRYRLIPELPDGGAARSLRRSVAVEVGLMLAVFLLAGALGSTAPTG